MARKPGRPRAGTAPLSREQILAAALRLIDSEGLDALSMRRLAAELGVDPMAIYHHLPGKRALLAGVAELAFGELRLPAEDGGPWQEQVRAFARAYRDLVLAHPNLALHLIRDLDAGGPALLAANESLYAALERAGLPPRQVARAADLIIDYLHGWALAAAPGPERPEAARGLAALLRRHPPERYPTLARIVASLGEDDRPGDIEDGLAVLLAGIATLAAGAGDARAELV